MNGYSYGLEVMLGVFAIAFLVAVGVVAMMFCVLQLTRGNRGA